MNSKLIICGCLLLAMMGVAQAAPGDEAPAWLRQAAAVNVPSFDKKVSSVVLVDESNMVVAEDGRLTRTSLFAIRILTLEGRKSAIAAEGYETDFGKIREMRAWMIQPSGKSKGYDNDDIIDETDLDDVYNESRVKKIVARDDAEVGSVFGFMVVSEMRPYFNQSMWYFQNLEPVVYSKLTLTLPAGWRATSITFNHSKVEPVVNGTVYSWELRDIAPLEVEPASPSLINLVPRLAVNYFPTEGTRMPASKAFESWGDVSRWYSGISDSQSQLDPRIIAKANELTANARTELEKIQAIARYVQNIQYISIQIGVGRWKPHAASEVLAKSYGDCKDKANLMRALLKVLNIESYPVLIYSGDPTFVQEVWPSPRQFNHCIIAVKISDQTQVATVLNHPTLGRLLIFDATDDNTPVGDLPDHEQGSFALLAAGDNGALMRMPTSSPETNQLDRSAQVQLSEDGSIVASLKERARGQSAVRYRREFRGLSKPDYLKRIERRISAGATSSTVTKVQPEDNLANGGFALDVDFSAPSYGQSMQNKLLVFKPAIVSRLESLFLTEAKRKHPVVLDAYAFSETVSVKLPAGFDVDEVPDALKLEAPFGSYKTSYDVKNGELVFTRTLAQRAGSIPVDQYQSVRSFFEKIRAAEQAPVVLIRK
ncbi:MAG TPA: DUF3857 domain-containing protein [Pyrinomonadaceae bacterium]|nr:DUF3857 domain-containing protein [Pyrinomonadaceae bacterium]